MKINFAVISKTGRRSKNEGYVKVIDKPEELRWLGVVCDGMGGHAMGDIWQRIILFLFIGHQYKFILNNDYWKHLLC